MMMHINKIIDGTSWKVVRGSHWRSVETSNTDWATTERRKGYLLTCTRCEGPIGHNRFFSEEQVAKGKLPRSCGCSVGTGVPLEPADDRGRTPTFFNNQREQLAAGVEAFLAGGGAITHVPYAGDK